MRYRLDVVYPMEFIPSLIKFFVNFWTDYVAAFVIDFFLGAL